MIVSGCLVRYYKLERTIEFVTYITKERGFYRQQFRDQGHQARPHILTLSLLVMLRAALEWIINDGLP